MQAVLPVQIATYDLSRYAATVAGALTRQEREVAVAALLHRIKLWDHHPKETAATTIAEAVATRDGNRTLAAVALGLNRRSLYNREKYLGVDLAAGERPE